MFLNAYYAADKFDINKRPDWFVQDTETGYYDKNLDETEAFLSRRAALVRMDKRHNGKAIVKTHSANLAVESCALIPAGITMSAVYVVRDPRDVVVSFADHFGHSIDDAITVLSDARRVTSGEGKMPQFLGSWSSNVQSWLDEDDFPVCVVKYEDLHANPQVEFRRVLEALHERVHDGRVFTAIQLTTFERLREAEETHGFGQRSEHQERFFRRGSVGGWRDVLSPHQVERIQNDHHQVMTRLGY